MVAGFAFLDLSRREVDQKVMDCVTHSLPSNLQLEVFNEIGRLYGRSQEIPLDDFTLLVSAMARKTKPTFSQSIKAVTTSNVGNPSSLAKDLTEIKKVVNNLSQTKTGGSQTLGQEVSAIKEQLAILNQQLVNLPKDSSKEKPSPSTNNRPLFAYGHPNNTGAMTFFSTKMDAQSNGPQKVGNYLCTSLGSYNQRNNSHYQLKTPSTPAQDRLPITWRQGKYLPTVQPIQFTIFRQQADGQSVNLSKQALEHFSTHCYKCGEPSCAASDRRCPYFREPDTWSLCTSCKRGFHSTSVCKASPNAEAM
jgi:hypothetical protein